MPDNDTLSPESPRPEEHVLRIRWPLTVGVGMDYCNQFAVSKTGPEYLLQIGRAFAILPPGWTPDEIRAAAGILEVDVRARILLSHKGLMALRDVIDKGLKRMTPEEESEATNLGS